MRWPWLGSGFMDVPEAMILFILISRQVIGKIAVLLMHRGQAAEIRPKNLHIDLGWIYISQKICNIILAIDTLNISHHYKASE